jgi:hypothetical protein
MRQFMAVLTLGLALLLAQSAAAKNLLTNGSFETGDFYGWSHQNDDNTWIMEEHPHSGRWALRVWGGYGEVDEGFRLSQTFPTISGQSYEVSRWRLVGSENNSLKVYWGDREILKIDNFYDWSPYEFVSSPPQIGAGAATTLEIVYDVGLHNHQFYLDDIQVKPIQNLVVNGNFETGDFTGWSRYDLYSSMSITRPGTECDTGLNAATGLMPINAWNLKKRNFLESIIGLKGSKTHFLSVVAA